MSQTNTVETSAVVSTGRTETMAETIARLTAENAALKRKSEAKAFKGLSFRVSEKGAISVYGLGRFPVTLYAEQWTKLLGADFAAEMQAFIKANAAQLKSKTKAVEASEAVAAF